MTNPSDRSKRMKALFGGVDPAALERLNANLPKAAAENPAQTSTPPEATTQKRVASGAIRSIADTFSTIEAENIQLRQQLAAADTILTLDPAKIHPSFVQDRLNTSSQAALIAGEPAKDPAFDSLVASIQADGQQVPILVRPHPERDGFYQIAYGHRRWRAAQQLNIPVQAIIRPLDDDALVIAQGKENSERKDLSFIEQAVFAQQLKERRFDRSTIAAALGRHESRGLAYISMITGIVAALPSGLIESIGPAPKSGRPKWEKLTSYFTDAKLSPQRDAAVTALINSAKFHGSDSDKRLNSLLNLLNQYEATDKPDLPKTRDLYGKDQKKYLSILPHADGSTIRINERQAQGLSDWLEAQLPALIAAFDKENGH